MKECWMTKKYKHITLDDRALIQTQLRQGFKPGAIVVSLNRPRSCITRELARNGWKLLLHLALLAALRLQVAIHPAEQTLVFVA